MNADGALDTGFQAGASGADWLVFAIEAQGEARILIGGAFTAVNGVSRPYLARLFGQPGSEPIVLTQPESPTVIAGANASLSLRVRGVAPLDFQWQFNGTNLPGAGVLAALRARWGEISR